MAQVAHVFDQVVRAVGHMHTQGYLHADIKTLNLVRTDSQWRLIDLDAACRIGLDPVGFKVRAPSPYPPLTTSRLVPACMSIQVY